MTADLLGGTDTLRFRAASAAVTVDLAGATASGFGSLAGIENVTGGGSGDVIGGNAGANALSGGGGNDRILADGGNDAISGGGGNDTFDLSATTADATVTSNSASSAEIGTDSLSGIENLISGQGNDTITFAGGVNIVDGQGGNDTIATGAGADTLIGGAGNDTMTGGAAADTYVFDAGFGADQIVGFDALAAGGQDRLMLLSTSGVTAANFASTVDISVSGADTLITIGADTITLLGVAAANVNQDDFLFSA